MKIFFLLFIIFSLTGCSGQKVKPAIDASLQVSKLPAQEGWNSTVTFSDSGKTKAILYYGHMRMFDQPAETLLDSSIKVDFFDQSGIKTTTLTALRGKVNNATNDLYAIDSVVAVSDSGVTLKTQELMWRNNDRKIVSDKFVTIVSPKEKIQGYGFESDQNLRNYTIYNITYVTRIDSSKHDNQPEQNLSKVKRK
ncbi:MAG: LPS export ABC transporter periplasmic protein LptC [Ignavibacteriaceae bacterium]